MVAKELGVTSKDVLEMESRMAAQDMAFDMSDDDDGDHRLWHRHCSRKINPLISLMKLRKITGITMPRTNSPGD